LQVFFVKISQFSKNFSAYFPVFSPVKADFDQRCPADSQSCNLQWAGAELNRRHTDFQSVALPAELPARLRLNLA
jgi:hypothetical protein